MQSIEHECFSIHMTLHVFHPQSLADWHSGHCLVREGLMVELGTIGFVGVDLCRSPADRGRILAMQYSDKVLHRESALWVHTGFHTSVLTTRIDVARDVPAADVVVIGGQQTTTLERTALDLLINRENHAVQYMCELVRAGTSVDAIEKLANQRSLGGVVGARSILKQLPRDLGSLTFSQSQSAYRRRTHPRSSGSLATPAGDDEDRPSQT